MASASNKLSKRKSNDEKNLTTPNSRISKKNRKSNKLAERQQEQNKIRNQVIAVVVIYVLIGVVVFYIYGVPKSKDIPPEVAEKIIEAGPQDAKKVQRPKGDDELNDDAAKREEKKTKSSGIGVDASTDFANFKPNVQNELTVKNINDKRTWKRVKIPRNNSTTSVQIYIMDNYLSPRECDGLIRAHEKHVAEYSVDIPLICFNDIESLRKHLKEFGLAKLSKRISENDFTPGTNCLNSTLSSFLKTKLRWSTSTSFYSGESKFAALYERKVQDTTGLDPRNGGKFQVTSYEKGVGYKGHTDCVVGNLDGRDRFATVLVYLTDVDEGGHTEFPELGVKVKPRKGRALLWNNMNSDGSCDPLSHHKAAKVVKGRKVILQRWYYYQNFPLLGQRYVEPRLPPRGSKTARVSCDEHEFGSCRWYDEWTYDHLTSYSNVKHTLS